MISVDELLRYSCQLQLPDFGEAKQQMLKDARVLIVGAGGLGCPAAQYLAAAGAGTITIADFDTISLSNLHRQILYSPDEVGMKKAEVACRKLQEQNPDIQLLPFTQKISAANVLSIAMMHDVVIDGSDNIETRYLLNDACVLQGKPLIYGAIYQYEGQVSVFNMQNQDGTRSPNYRDVFPEVDAALIPNCSEGGVIPTLAGIIGCMQANEAIKVITGTGKTLAGHLLLFDARTLQSRIMKTGTASQVTITGISESIPVDVISAEELRTALVEGSCELIDVRTAAERNSFSIGGRHIPMEELDVSIRQIQPSQKVVFYCATGRRSAEAVRIFRRYFPGVRAYSLEGGIKIWKEKLAHIAAP
jgi:adenylyltransferase/sulfurtransferase